MSLTVSSTPCHFKSTVTTNVTNVPLARHSKPCKPRVPRAAQGHSKEYSDHLFYFPIPFPNLPLNPISFFSCQGAARGELCSTLCTGLCPRALPSKLLRCWSRIASSQAQRALRGGGGLVRAHDVYRYELNQRRRKRRASLQAHRRQRQPAEKMRRKPDEWLRGRAAGRLLAAPLTRGHASRSDGAARPHRSGRGDEGGRRNNGHCRPRN